MTTFFDHNDVNLSYMRTDTEQVAQAVVPIKCMVLTSHEAKPLTSSSQDKDKKKPKPYPSQGINSMAIRVNELVCTYADETDLKKATRRIQLQTSADAPLRYAGADSSLLPVFASLSGMHSDVPIRPVGISLGSSQGEARDMSRMVVGVAIQGTYSIRHTGTQHIKQGDMVFIRGPTEQEAAKQIQSVHTSFRVLPITESVRGYWRLALEQSPEWKRGVLRHTRDDQVDEDNLDKYLKEKQDSDLKDRDDALKYINFGEPKKIFNIQENVVKSNVIKVSRMIKRATQWIDALHKTGIYDSELVHHIIADTVSSVQDYRRNFTASLLGVAMNHVRANTLGSLDVFVGRSDWMGMCEF